MTPHSPTITRLLTLALAAAAFAVPAPAAAGARITVINADGPNEGFNDPTPAAPVGGNPGTTKGQQRLIAFQFAADIWGAALDSNIDIQIQASFDPLGANVLGAAAATASTANEETAEGFPGLAPNTNYHIALANKRTGRDIPAEVGLVNFPEVVAQFSSDFDFYLGLDNNHGARNDLVVVLLHELGHGLGFSSFMSRVTGNTPGNRTDTFLDNVIDGSTNGRLAPLAPADRLAAIRKVDQIAWTGSEVAAAVPSTLVFGRPELTVLQPSTVPGGRYGTAAFGPPVPAAGITGTVIVAQDGTAPSSTDACEPLTAASALAVRGNIALVDRGTCNFNVKVKNAQDAGAVAVLVADNAPDNPPVTLGGADATITIPSVRILRDTGTAIKAATTPVIVTIGFDFSRRAGTDLQDRALLYASNPIINGSTLNHWDPIASRNLLMEPSINGDLTHSLIAPFDTTLAEMHDIGWYTDANLDGAEDATVIVNGCDTGVANDLIATGARLADQARAWFGACEASTSNTRAFDACVDDVTKAASKANVISARQGTQLRRCALQSRLPTTND